MAKIIATLCLLFILTGCCTPPKPIYIIAECPEPPVIARPSLEVDTLNKNMDSGQVIQAHRITIKQLQKWGLEQEAILNGYRKKP